MGTREDIKSIITQAGWTQKELVNELNKHTDKKYSDSSFSQKLSTENLRYKEAKLIAELLGYELQFIKK